MSLGVEVPPYLKTDIDTFKDHLAQADTPELSLLIEQLQIALNFDEHELGIAKKNLVRRENDCAKTRIKLKVAKDALERRNDKPLIDMIRDKEAELRAAKKAFDKAQQQLDHLKAQT